MTGVISPYARQRVREYVEGNMDGLVTVVRGKRGGLDPVTGNVKGLVITGVVYGGAGVTVDNVDADAGGKARVHLVAGQGTVSNGPGEFDMRQVTISIPFSADPQSMPRRDDVVLIRSGGQDGELNGQTARVLSADGGGLFGEARRMQCTLWGRSEYWTSQGTAPGGQL